MGEQHQQYKKQKQKQIVGHALLSLGTHAGSILVTAVKQNVCADGRQ